MGFNIGVYSDQVEANHDCYRFIERTFYNFVNSGEMYGDQSILIQSGNYYELDLSPLLRLVYTWDGVTEDEVKANLQNTDTLLGLVTTFRDKIISDPYVCNKILYVWYESSIGMTDEEMEEFIKEVGGSAARDFFEMLEERKREIEENPNPWKWYFEERQIVGDLDNLIARLQCYKEKGATEIYLTAG